MYSREPVRNYLFISATIHGLSRAFATLPPFDVALLFPVRHLMSDVRGWLLNRVKFDWSHFLANGHLGLK